MTKKQIAVIALVFVTMGYLYSRPVKGLVKPKESRNNTAGVAPEKSETINVTVESVSALAIAGLEPTVSQQITTLENSLKSAPADQKPAIQRQLATKWDQVHQPAPAAFYYQQLAEKDNDFADWVNAGNRFNEATKANEDVNMQVALSTKAVDAFNHATKLKPADLEAKTGLGVAYVNGGGMPMQGISLLLEVVKQDPENWQANLNLGMFSIKSGQYDKAVGRFKTLVAQREEFEPYFYLAECYKQLGHKEEAIAAYEKCKKLMGDPVGEQRIDEFIKELKK